MGDEGTVKSLFAASLHALEIVEDKSKGRRSPVGVAKTLHLLAPAFFPLWDLKIAIAYRCRYSADPAGKYLAFMRMQQSIVSTLEETIESLSDGKSPLKVLDEYNYAKFTKEWI